jgi:micrococcal nuclease
MSRRPFQAVPLKAVRNRPPPRRMAWWRQVSPIMVMLPLAVGTAVFLWDIPTAGSAVAADAESASFSLCGGGARVNCVVDGDAFWYRGDKIRVADINTPEVSSPECAAEAALGRRATGRLHALLNAGPFTLESIERDRDRYGRQLRVVTRGGESLGDVLVSEGLAEEWAGYRGGWC